MGGPRPWAVDSEGNGGPQKDTSEDRQRVRQKLIDPSIRLKLARKTEKDPIVEMFGDQGRKTIFYTEWTQTGHTGGSGNGRGGSQMGRRQTGEFFAAAEEGVADQELTRFSPDGLQLWEVGGDGDWEG